MRNDCHAAFRRALGVTLIAFAFVACKKAESVDTSKGSAEPAVAPAKTAPARPPAAEVDAAMLTAAQTALDTAYKGTEREPPKSAMV